MMYVWYGCMMYVVCSTFANSPVSFHEPCLPTGAPPGSSRQEFQKGKHSSRTEATAKTLASTEENTGNSERKTNATTGEPSPQPTTNTSPNNNLRQAQ